VTDTDFGAAVRRVRAGEPDPALAGELLALLSPYVPTRTRSSSTSR
jgi:hypothetical protein